MSDPQQSPDRPRRWWIAGLLSLALPGLGQVYNGEWRKAVAVNAAAVALVAVAIPLLQTDLMVAACAVALLAAMAYWVGLFVDAIRGARRRRHQYLLAPYNRVWVYVAILAGVTLGSEAAKGLVREEFVRAFRTPGRSMSPALEEGDHFFADMRSSARRPRPGDVVVFRDRRDRRMLFVKRVVAVAGEQIEIRDHDDRRPYGPLDRRLVAGRARAIYWSWDAERGRVRWERIGLKVR